MHVVVPCMCTARVQLATGSLVCITHTAVACLSEVIASLSTVACRQQCLISGLNGEACDSGSKCLCPVSLIWPLSRNGRAPGRGSDAERGPKGDNSSQTPNPLWLFWGRLRLVVIRQTGPGSRTIYSLWWQGPGGGSIGTRQVQREEGVRSVGNRNQRWS